MQTQLETELKVLIDQTVYARLHHLAERMGAKTVLQTNQYFDTPDFDLVKSGISIRIRQKEEESMMTVKTSLQTDRLSLHCDEHNMILTKEQAQALLSDPALIKKLLFKQSLTLPAQHMAKIGYRGFLCTHRSAFSPVPDLPPIELDKSEYLGTTDYELEWEYKTCEQKDRMLVWLKNNHIQARTNCLSTKISRFMTRSQQINAL